MFRLRVVCAAALLAAYDLGEARAFKGIAEGVQNSNFLLETEQGRFILTLFEKRTNRADLPFFMGMMGHLAEKGFPAPLPVPAKDGKALRTIQGKPAVIITFLRGMSPRRPDIEQCRHLRLKRRIERAQLRCRPVPGAHGRGPSGRSRPRQPSPRSHNARRGTQSRRAGRELRISNEHHH